MSRIIIKYSCSHLKIVPSRQPKPKRSLWNLLHAHPTSSARLPLSGDRGFVVERVCDACFAEWGRGAGFEGVGEGGKRLVNARTVLSVPVSVEEEVLADRETYGDISSQSLDHNVSFGFEVGVDNFGNAFERDKEDESSSLYRSLMESTSVPSFNSAEEKEKSPPIVSLLLWQPNQPPDPNISHTPSPTIYYHPVSPSEAHVIWDTFAAEVSFPPRTTLWKPSDGEVRVWSLSASSSSGSDYEEDFDEEPISITDHEWMAQGHAEKEAEQWLAAQELAIDDLSLPLRPFSSTSNTGEKEEGEEDGEIISISERIDLERAKATGMLERFASPPRTPRPLRSKSRTLPRYPIWAILHDEGYDDEAASLVSRFQRAADAARLQVQRALARSQLVATGESVTVGVLDEISDEAGGESRDDHPNTSQVIDEGDEVLVRLVAHRSMVPYANHRYRVYEPSSLRVELRIVTS